MRRLIAFLMSCVLVVGLLPLSAHADEGVRVGSVVGFFGLEAASVGAVDATFADQHLYEAVVDQLGAQGIAYRKDDSAKNVKLTAADNAKLTRLELNNREITDISGLEAFTGLTWLNLSHNLVKTTSQFSNMKRLEHLDLYDNAVHDFSGLAGLTTLTHLNLGDNNEVSKTTLAGLDVIDKLTGLTYFDFSRNYEPGIVSHLTKLTKLTFLNLQQNGIKDVPELAGLKKLKTLILCYNDLSGVSALAECASLEELNLQCNQLYIDGYGEDNTGIDALFDDDGNLRLTKLKKLDLWGNWNWNGFLGKNSKAHTQELYERCKAGTLELGFSYDRIKDFDTAALIHEEDGVRYVIYDDFRVYCDGVHDDFNAIRNAHRFANANGCEVRATAGRTYHIFRLYDLEYHTAYTDIDWQGATFVIHDEDVDGYAVRYTPMLCLRPSAANDSSAYDDRVTIPNALSSNPSDSQKADAVANPHKYQTPLTVRNGKKLTKQTTSIAGLSPEVDAALAALKQKGYERCYVMVYDANTRHYKRFGVGSSSDQWDGFIVDADGKLERTDPVPIQWDFTGLTQVIITPIPAKRGYVKNGNFVSMPIASETETPYERGGDKSIYYLRNLQFRECANIEIANITQTVGTEEAGFDNDKLSGSYTGFLTVNYCADVNMHDCTAWTRRYDYSGRSTYGITLNSNVDITLTCVSCSNPWEQLLEVGGRRWGVTGTNHNKHIVFDQCTLNRIDAHEGFYDMTARDCKLGNWSFRLTGQGPLTIERCDVYADTFITLRSDYGSTWDGDARIIDCTHHYVRRDSSSQNLISVSKSYDDAAKTQEHDFGYELHHPNVYVKNLTVDERYFTVREGDYMPFRTTYGILSNYEFSNADKFGEDYWPDTVEIDGIDFVNYEDTIGYEPHLRMPVNETGAVMEKLDGYSIKNLSYNGQVVAADVSSGVPLLDESRDVVSGDEGSRLAFHSFTDEQLGSSGIVVEFSGVTPTLVLVDAAWKGWTDVPPYYIERGADADVAYYSNSELLNRWEANRQANGAEPLDIMEVRTTGATRVERVALLDAHAHHEHEWGSWEQAKAPTCEGEGEEERICAIDEGHVQTRVVAALGHKYGAWQRTEAPTCAKEGAEQRICAADATHVETRGVSALGHEYGAWKKLDATQHQRVCSHDSAHKQTANHTWNKGVVTTTPTTAQKGVRTYTCATCGGTKTESIAKLINLADASVSLSKASYVYDAKAGARKPSVTVKLKGKKVASGNYTVSYATGRKAVGAHKVTVKGKGLYGGSKSVSFTIVPKATSLSKLVAAKKGFTAKWKKQAAQTTGYQLQYSLKSSFKSPKTVTVANPKMVSKKVAKLKAKAKYWVRVRTYKRASGKVYYSAWSKAKAVTTKK